MLTYTCLFCGAKYHTPLAMLTCTVCGQTETSGWFYEEQREQVNEQTDEQVQPHSFSAARTRTLRPVA